MRTSFRHVGLVLIIVLLAPMLIACGDDGATADPTPPDIGPPPGTVQAPNSPFTGTPAPQSPSTPAVTVVPATPSPSVSTPLPSPPETDAHQPRNLTPAELLEYKPNELGGIPIFMYHNIVTDTTLEGHLYRTADEFYADLQWLYDNNFYLVGMNDVVRGQIDAPAGKHPVVLTFDDSSSMHLSFEMGPDGQPLLDEQGDYVITPNSAVGIIERFASQHPDFGKTAHFSTIPQFKFSWPEYAQDEWYDEKVIWLLANGYEIGDHTSDHQDMVLLSNEDFVRNIAEPYIWISDIVDESDPNFAMGILTLPYGAYPEGGWKGEKFEYLKDGFQYEGRDIKVEGVLLVCCGPNPSPFSTEYSRLWIPRIRGDDPDFQRLKDDIANDWVILYTSDGNAETVTVPWPLPKYQWGKLDTDAIEKRGLTLVKYHPDTGKLFTALGPQQRQAYNRKEHSHASA